MRSNKVEIRCNISGAIVDIHLYQFHEQTVESVRVWPIRDGPPVGKPVAIRVEHPDYDVARSIVDQIKQRLRRMPGVSDVSDNLQLGNRELVLRVDYAQGMIQVNGRPFSMGRFQQTVSQAMLATTAPVAPQPQSSKDDPTRIQSFPASPRGREDPNSELDEMRRQMGL